LSSKQIFIKQQIFNTFHGYAQNMIKLLVNIEYIKLMLTVFDSHIYWI